MLQKQTDRRKPGETAYAAPATPAVAKAPRVAKRRHIYVYMLRFQPKILAAVVATGNRQAEIDSLPGTPLDSHLQV